MKKTVIIISLFLLGTTFFANAQEMTQKEKNNYAIGVLLGKKIAEEIQKSGIDPGAIEFVKEFFKEKVDIESIKGGFSDILKGECKLSREEIETILMDLEKEKGLIEKMMGGNKNQGNESEIENPLYAELITEAWSLYESKEYLKSGQKYNEAFNALDGKEMSCCDRYNAACSWALANKIDSAFEQLFIVANSGSFPNIEHIISDADLISLHKDKRWNDFIEIIQSKVFLEYLEKLEEANAIPEKSKVDVEKIKKMLKG